MKYKHNSKGIYIIAFDANRDTRAENGEKLFDEKYIRICNTHIRSFARHRWPLFVGVFILSMPKIKIFSRFKCMKKYERNDECIRSIKLLICLYPNREFKWISFVRFGRLNGRRSRFFVSVCYFSIQTSVLEPWSVAKEWYVKRRRRKRIN